MPSLSASILATLRYSDQYAYSLTAKEIKYWLINQPSFTASAFASVLNSLEKKGIVSRLGNYYFLSGHHKSYSLRLLRRRFSKAKWQIARKISHLLIRIPTVCLVAATGSLAMNNCEEEADIDLMIITLPHALWITRALVWLILTLKGIRRSPHVSDPDLIKNRICDNLYLDLSSLDLSRLPNFSAKKVFLAHEILQAKPLSQHVGIYSRFLLANPWVSAVLPRAYASAVSAVSNSRISQNQSAVFNLLSFLLLPFNYVFFLVQYLYQLPKMTTEYLTIHSAFFHPRH